MDFLKKCTGLISVQNIKPISADFLRDIWAFLDLASINIFTPSTISALTFCKHFARQNFFLGGNERGREKNSSCSNRAFGTIGVDCFWLNVLSPVEPHIFLLSQLSTNFSFFVNGRPHVSQSTTQDVLCRQLTTKLNFSTICLEALLFQTTTFSLTFLCNCQMCTSVLLLVYQRNYALKKQNLFTLNTVCFGDISHVS